MLSSLRQFVTNRYSSGDRLGILLALVIGTGGLVFVFFLPDPILDLAPQVPILSPQDWPGSYANQELSVRQPELTWQEERRFFQNLLLHNEVRINNTISQEVIWYADPLEAASSWQHFTRQYEATYGEQAVDVTFTSNAENNKPESRLFCRREGMANADDPHVCAYFAQWGHWFTQVMFFQEMQLAEIQPITARIDQQLMLAQAEPCYWIFCTSQRGKQD
jgi:hypothetical protein